MTQPEIRLIDEEAFPEVYRANFKRDFPKGELRPLFATMPLFKKGIYTCYGYYDGNTLLAYATFIHHKEHGDRLLDYMAVIPVYRSQGIGQAFLTSLINLFEAEHLTTGLLIEVETPEAANNPDDQHTRHRRIQFYARCGAITLPIRGITFGVDYQILYIPLIQDNTQQEPDILLHHLQSLYYQMLPKPMQKMIGYKLTN